MNALTATTLLALSGLAHADPGANLEAFLATRKERSLSGISSSAALASISPGTPVELVGTFKGVIQIGEDRRYLFEGTGGTWVGTNPPPAFATYLRRGVMVRWIGLGTRTETGLQCELIAGLENFIVAHHDEKAAALSSLPKRPPANPLDGLSGSIIRDPSDPAHLYADFILRQNAALEREEAEEIAIVTLALSKRYGIDARLAIAVMLVESSFNPQSRTPEGRLGLSGLPGVLVRSFAVANPYDIREGIWCAVKRVSNGFVAARPHGGELEVALLGYRHASIDGSGVVPSDPDPATQAFVQTVLKSYRSLTGTSS